MTKDLGTDLAVHLLIDEEVERRVAAATRIHNLKVAAARLRDVRDNLRAVNVLLEGETEITGIVAGIIVNPLESAMWKVEQAIRGGKT